MENLWGILAPHVYGSARQFAPLEGLRSVEELRSAVNVAWAEIGLGTI